ncbi:MAG TPA: SDR family oxidoreductase [Methylomirabilota bacterium]|jgi:NAD(P)-dependent dehydrogenase (short-subunit alcohol dehydrogenase family)|nr:SDR family oxidoreductase [Methylomirabilota bacterium]
MEKFAGKVSLVTGAGRGIGKAIALSLAKLGCRVILAARTEAQLAEVEREIRRLGGEGIAIPTDLTRDEDIERLVTRIEREAGAVDILINNAGWGKRAPVVRASIPDWDQTLRLNLRAPMVLAQRFLPAMIAKGEGAVINIGSVSGKTGEANGAAYSASKFGLIGFTQSLYEEVREHGIKVSVILPGYVDTPMIPPVKHLDRGKMIRPDDIAQTVLFVLTSPTTCCPVEITVRPQRAPNR